jgi:TRAP-type mannitol/chloroaromatic compound transport system permease small subunit
MEQDEIACTGFFRATAEGTRSCLDAWEAGGPIQWVLGNFFEAPFNVVFALANPSSWLGWTQALETPEDKQTLMRFVYYGASVELFFVVFILLLIVTGVGFAKRDFLWGVVRGSEAVLNWIGRVAAWAGLLMVLQQVMIVFLQRIFRVSEISIGPLGTAFTRDLSWYSEELKLYNAIIVCLCVAWTFIQGGHVRVDLVYSVVGHRAKRMIDMIGCWVFMMPALILIWVYGWFYLWGSLISPRLSASQDLDTLLQRARGVRWNVETIGFSPNGFDAYFLFKFLIVLFAATAFAQAWVFFWRSFLEWKEGEISAGRYLDRDVIGDEVAEREHAIHSGSS